MCVKIDTVIQVLITREKILDSIEMGEIIYFPLQCGVQMHVVDLAERFGRMYPLKTISLIRIKTCMILNLPTEPQKKKKCYE